MTLHMIAGLRDVKAADRRFPAARKAPKQQAQWVHPAQILNSIGDPQSIAAQREFFPVSHPNRAKVRGSVECRTTELPRYCHTRAAKATTQTRLSHLPASLCHGKKKRTSLTPEETGCYGMMLLFTEELYSPPQVSIAL
ncbi:hypothetical protein DTO271G3_5512 [Paecilomyces variotii]|nr:hypothetical protein DTO271G3_5512 [Paecilomyces variotii]